MELIQPQPEALIDFKKMTHAFFSAYVMSGAGMLRFAEQIKTQKGVDMDGLFLIGDGPPETTNPIVELPTSLMLKSMEDDGLFSRIIAEGLIVWMYAIWEESRKLIAQELSISDSNRIAADLMGDVGLIRNWIAHNKSRADRKVPRIKVLNWPKEEGLIQITSSNMDELKKQLNLMQVYLRD